MLQETFIAAFILFYFTCADGISRQARKKVLSVVNEKILDHSFHFCYF